VCVCSSVVVWSYSSIVEPSGFRVLGIVGALGDTFQTKLSLNGCARLQAFPEPSEAFGQFAYFRPSKHTLQRPPGRVVVFWVSSHRRRTGGEEGMMMNSGARRARSYSQQACDDVRM
jgi:hypothetical protein